MQSTFNVSKHSGSGRFQAEVLLISLFFSLIIFKLNFDNIIFLYRVVVAFDHLSTTIISSTSQEASSCLTKELQMNIWN